MSEDVSVNKMVLSNGTILVKYCDGMTPLRLRPVGGRKATVEQFIEELRGRLMDDERIEINGPVISVRKTYGI